MKAHLTLASFLGNARVVDILRRAIEQDRLPHALVFAGPSGVGKCTLAVLLAQLLNCPSPRNGEACGCCATCRRIMAVVEARYLACRSLGEDGFCGVCSNCKKRMERHPDVRLVEPEKTTITIEQVRTLIGEIAFQPFEARFRVVILDPAEQMRPEAHNSLLKTLEEPASRTVIVLVTTNPYLLLETIRSRSRMLQFGGIPQHQIETHLIEHGRAPEEARLAAIFCNGSLGTALSFDVTQYREVRSRALGFASLLLKGGPFTEANAVAASVAKDKGDFELWLRSLEALLHDVYFAKVAPRRMAQWDIQADLEGLAAAASRDTVVSAIEAVKKLRSGLHYNVNRQIALEALFLSVTSSAE